MDNDKIILTNKIITADDLIEIFSLMNDKFQYYKKIYYSEEAKNKVLNINYQNYTFKDIGSTLNFLVKFNDNSKIKFDDYNKFLAVFNYRLNDIKSIYVTFDLDYGVTQKNSCMKYYRHKMYMYIYENKIELGIYFDNQDPKMEDIYEFIKMKFSKAPIKYDTIIKKKDSIVTTTEFVVGFIPAIIIVTLVAIIFPQIRMLFSESYVLYPIFCSILSLIIGTVALANKFEDLYKNIIPEKRYVGWHKNGAKYKDDINEYVGTCEILIGKNVNNLECRKKIKSYYKNNKNKLFPSIIMLIIMSILIIIFGKIL